jgi:hypothetical protein
MPPVLIFHGTKLDFGHSGCWVAKQVVD